MSLLSIFINLDLLAVSVHAKNDTEKKLAGRIKLQRKGTGGQHLFILSTSQEVVNF